MKHKSTFILKTILCDSKVVFLFDSVVSELTPEA